MIRNSVLFLLLLTLPAFAREKAQGSCERGGTTIQVTAGLQSIGTVQTSYPSCTVTVYLANTVTLATLYSDNAGTSQANPFTAASDGSWYFYADDGRFDVQFSAGGIPSPFTRGDYQLFDWGFTQSGVGAVSRTVKTKLAEWVSITDFGAIGDNVTDSTASIQATYTSVAITGGTVWWPCGLFKSSGTVNIAANVVTQGAGRECASLTNSNIAVPAFKYLSPILSVFNDVNVGIRFSDISIYSRKALQFNNETIPTAPSFQGNLLNIIIDHVKIRGDYDTQTDANKWTSVKPSLGELKGYGALVSCNQCFNLVVTGSQIQYGGIGVYLQGDENIIEGFTRVTWNAVNVYLDGSVFQNQSAWNHIRDSIISQNVRYGAITEVNGFYNLITGNVQENYCPSSNFVYSRASYGLMYSYNTIPDPNQPPGTLCTAQGGTSYASNVTPILDLDNHESNVISYNTMGIGAGAIPPMLFGYTYWDKQRPILYTVTDNNNWWPTPNGQFNAPIPSSGTTYIEVPAVAVAPIDPLLFKPNNIPRGEILGASATSFANTFYQSPTTGRWVFKPGDFILKFNIPAGFAGFYEFRFTARKVGSGAGAVSIAYTGLATTTIFTGNLTFTDANEIQTRSVVPTQGTNPVYQIPPGEVMNGTWQVTITGDAEYESIRLVPIRKTTTTVTFSGTPTLNLAEADSQKITLTGNVTAPTFINMWIGQILNLTICQDATGGRTFAFPSLVPQKFYGAGTINSSASICSYQIFQYDGANFKALTAMNSN